MARLFHFEFWDFDLDLVYKSIRQVISVCAWSWAILVFILGYFGRGHYNHVNNNNELAPPPLFQAVFVPVLKVLVVAPSAFGLAATNINNKNNDAAQPGSAGHHGSVQSGQFLISNNENYGLEFTPYISPEQQKQQQQQQWSISPQQRDEGGELCAGCLPLTMTTSTQFHSQQPQSPNNNAGFGYSVNLQQQSRQNQPQQWGAPLAQKQQQQQQWAAPQQQTWGSPPTAYQQQQHQLGNQWAVKTPQQREGGSQYGSQIGNSGAGFGYSVNYQGQGQQRQQQQPLFNQQWSQPQQQQQQFNQDPATVQHLQINDDGQYSFSYNAADSSRQEQRNLDGSVFGNYAYTDPSGKQVQVDYRASPNEGYHAFGSNIPSFNSVQQQLPVPVQDTPEVQAAKTQFFQAYEQQLQRIQTETAARATVFNNNEKKTGVGNNKVVSIYSSNGNVGQQQGGGQSVSVSGGVENEDGLKSGDDGSSPVKTQLASASDFKNLPEPIAVPDSNGLTHSELEEDDESDNDAIVISSDDASPTPSSIRQNEKKKVNTQAVQSSQVGNTGGPDASYQLSQIIGADVGQYQQQWAVPVGQRGGDVQGQWQQGQQNQGQWQQGQQNQGQWPQAQQVQRQQGQSSQGDSLKSGLPAYFYYVSVGGSPHYVTSSNLMTSNFPTSLKASLAGAIPAAAVHDAQTPYNSQSGGQFSSQQQNKVTPPVYLDVDKKSETLNNNWNVQPLQQNSYVLGYIPGAIVSFRNDGVTTGNNNKEQGQVSSKDQQIPVVGYPLLVFKNP